LRSLAEEIIELRQISIRRSCRLLKLNRGTYRYTFKRKNDTEIIDLLQRLSEKWPRWGFRKMYDWLRYEGQGWNHKKIRRIYREMKLHIRIRPKKRLPSRHPQVLSVPNKLNDSWSMDFMADGLSTGKAFRTLNIIDDYNREVLAIEVEYSFPAARVVRVLNQVVEERGYPRQIRVDNGPEFISTRLRHWAIEHDVKLEHIQPGKPAQNAYIERFNRTFREDILNMYMFRNLTDVRDLSTKWMIDYNDFRPHTALGGIPPKAVCFSIEKFPVLTGT
jgi:putative transposase